MQGMIAAYLLSKEAAGCADGTLYGYRLYLAAFADFCRKPINKVADSDAVRWIASERAKGLAPASVAVRHKVLRAFFNWCVESEVIERTPLKMKAPKLPKKTPRIASLRHIKRLLDAPVRVWKDYRDRALIALLLDTGMRIGEAVSLAPGHIDLARCIVQIPAAKDREDRHAPFTERCAELLTDYLHVRPGGFTPVFLRARAGQAVGPMLVADAQWMMRKRCQHLGIDPYVNLHSIRHLFAMKALNDGIRVETVSRILGHASVDFTLKYYAHLLTDTIQREYNQHWQA